MAENRATTSLIQIYTFGALSVVRDGNEIEERDWRTRQARQLLKFLITERPLPVSTDRLIETLWPESTPDAAATTLRSAVNALRNVLEPDRPNRAPSSYIHTQSPGYAFRPHREIWLDVDAFERMLAEAERNHDLVEKRKLLEGALALYKDDYLLGDPYADWAKPERERLRERFFDALLALAALYAREGNYSAALSSCRRVLARDEVRETAYQALMRYQAESGDSAAALLTYERCRFVLSEQLGADPSPLTQQLHGRILNGEIETAPVATLASHTVAQDARANAQAHTPDPGAPLPQQILLPPQASSTTDLFVGREQEVASLEEALQQALAGSGSIRGLAGEMGVGKSRLAYQVLRCAEADGATVISATCQRLEQNLPYAPLADAVGRYLHLLSESSLRRLPQSALLQLSQILPGLHDRLDMPAPPELQLTPEENRQRLIEGIVGFLVGLAQLRPLVFFLDDLHWADPETLAVVSRLSARLSRAPMLLLMAYRPGDLVENEMLQTLLHALRRISHSQIIPLERLGLHDVRSLISRLSSDGGQVDEQLVQILYETTAGNALFLTEALKALQERSHGQPLSAILAEARLEAGQYLQDLGRNERVQEIIQERIERLPADALGVLQLAAVIGRDFSLDLLEQVATSDPLDGLDILLRRQFLIERPDDRLDFVHQIVRQVAYDGLNNLLRRRLHRQVAIALEKHRHSERNPAEIAFHYAEAGLLNRLEYARYSILAGEKLLRTFSLNQAIVQFDHALSALEALPEGDPELVERALMGRGLAYESLLDPDGVTETYSRLRQWALQEGNKDLAWIAHTRLTTLLGLVGQQAESNVVMEELILERNRTPSPALADLLERRQRLFSPDGDGPSGEAPVDPDGWASLQPPPVMPDEPVEEIVRSMGTVHAALPLLIYGWALQVQGQIAESIAVLEEAIALSEETEQRSLASLAYHQLAVSVRFQGDLERSQKLNDQSKTLNQQVHGTGAQLASLWPRISSAYQALERGELTLAADRLHRVQEFLDSRDSFRTHLNSTIIGLGLVALAQGQMEEATQLLEQGLADLHHRYPFTYVKGLLGLARIAHHRGEQERSKAILQRALRYAGDRSLLREYAECVQTLTELFPAEAPVERLQREVMDSLERAGLLHANNGTGGDIFRLEKSSARIEM
jgi:DNA-binding SARP family transcriptional activator